jgi:hypothetical protein
LPLHELGIMCWGTPPNPPTTPWILDIKLCCHDQMQACLQRLDVAISYLLLLRSTCHDPSFMSPYPSSFCEPTATHLSHWPTPYCITWVTPANVSMTYAYDAYGPVSRMRMHGIFVSQGHDLMMNSSFKPLRIYKTVFKTSHLYTGNGHSTVPAPSRAMPLLGSFYP